MRQQPLEGTPLPHPRIPSVYTAFSEAPEKRVGIPPAGAVAAAEVLLWGGGTPFPGPNPPP